VGRPSPWLPKYAQFGKCENTKNTDSEHAKIRKYNIVTKYENTNTQFRKYASAEHENSETTEINGNHCQESNITNREINVEAAKVHRATLSEQSVFEAAFSSAMREADHAI
jgi:hypothetical protein